MNYEEVEGFLSEVSKSGSRPGLERIANLMRLLGDVQDRLLVIHIAGTNGKGSVGAFLESIFQEAGFTVGRFCSPAVFSTFDMWRCRGREISINEYVGVMSQVKRACDIVVSEGGEMPTLFEIQTAAAFVWFAGRLPDVVLLEAGMGGAGDATNLIRYPLCSVVTSISMDHTDYLGTTLEEIAEEKAGIIKPGRPVFSAPQEPEVEKVLRDRAKEKNALFAMVRREQVRLISQSVKQLDFYYKDVILSIGLVGLYQMENAALAVRTGYYMIPVLRRYLRMRKEGISMNQVMEELRESSREAETPTITSLLEDSSKSLWQSLKIRDMSSFRKLENMAVISKALAETTWPGRFEVFGVKAPWFILDGAHNPAAAESLVRTVKGCFGDEKLTYIIGVLADKEYERILAIMAPCGERVFCVTPDSPRALPAERLAECARKYYPEVSCCGSVKEALWTARDGKHTVLAFGSLSYLRQVKDNW